MAEVAGITTADNMRQILDTVRYLRNSGFVIQPPGNAGQTLSPETPIFFRNDSGAIVPAFACMQSTGTVEAGGQNYIKCNKPVDITGAAGGYFFNSPAEVEIGGYGVCYAGPFVRSMKSGTTASGGRCRPTISQWYVTVDATGQFTMIGDDDIGTNILRIIVAPPNVTLTVVTDVRVSGTDLQYKTRSIQVLAAGTESAWTTWHTGTTC